MRRELAIDKTNDPGMMLFGTIGIAGPAAQPIPHPSLGIVKYSFLVSGSFELDIALPCVIA